MVGTGTNEVYVGRDYGARQVEVTPDLVRHYAESVGDHNPWYFGGSPFGGQARTITTTSRRRESWASRTSWSKG